MNRKAYELANEIRTEFETDSEHLMSRPDGMEMSRYKTAIRDEIRKEKKTQRQTFAKTAAAACAATALLAGTAVFAKEARAALLPIAWNIESALGLSKSLADYCDVIHTSTADQGYVVTLQEAVAAEEKLIVNYTIQREDGQPFDQYLTPIERLYVNRKPATGGSGGSVSFLNDAQTIVGVEMSYEIPGMDMCQENEFRIEISQLEAEDRIKGKWNFAFVASGAELMADTRRVSIGQEFTLPDGVTVTLKELAMNELEQRITYETSAPTSYLLQILAEDEEGHLAEFGVRMSDKSSGYMSNEEILYDGRIPSGAALVRMTLNAVKLPEESGRIPNDYEQVGETFTLNLLP